MVIHDMRVPLTAVLGSVETLAELTESKLNAQETKLLNIAVSSGEILLNMINDLLDISKLEADKLTLNKGPVPVRQLIEQAVCQIAFFAERKALSIAVDVPTDLREVMIDRSRISRVIVNLLDNSRKHTPAGGHIVVSARQNSDQMEIRISDTGRGIPKDDAHRIFDKFAQLESGHVGGRPSPGLGLAFCQMMVEAHGGRLWVESEQETGCTFIFTLPI